MHAKDALARRSVAVMARGEMAKCAVKGGKNLKKDLKNLKGLKIKPWQTQYLARRMAWMHTAQPGIVLEMVLRSMIESFAVAPFQ